MNVAIESAHNGFERNLCIVRIEFARRCRESIVQYDQRQNTISKHDSQNLFREKCA